MSSQPGRVSRRRLLALLAAAAAAGCTSDQQRVPPSPSGRATGPSPGATTAVATGQRPTSTGRHSALTQPPATSAPPDPLLAQLRTELALVAAYDAAIRTHPDLASGLSGIRGNHAAHVDALRSLIGPSADRALPSAGPTASEPSTTESGASLGHVRSTLSSLEQAAAADYAAAAITAAPDRAALLGSIAACERTHPGLLDAATDLEKVPDFSGVGSADVAALQETLGAEHAVVWGYDVVGGQSATARQPAVQAAQGRHGDLVALLTTAIAAQHQTPVAPQAGYQLPFAVSGQAGAVKLAIHLEDGAAAAWRHLLARVASAGVRRTAVAALADCAVQSVIWRAAPGPAFPGIASS
jgi:hypothetical protein